MVLAMHSLTQAETLGRVKFSETVTGYGNDWRKDASELRSCVKVEVAVLGSPSLVVRMVAVDVKRH